MKKFLYTSLAIAGLLFNSCTPPAGNMTISTRADFEKVKKLMTEKMGDTDYISLSFFTDVAERCHLDQINTTYNDSMSFYSFSLDKVFTSEIKETDAQKANKKNKFLKSFYESKVGIKPVKVSSFNVDEFFEVKDKAIKMIEEKSKNFGDYKVRSLNIDKTKKGGNKYNFTFIAIKQNGEISYIGEKMDPNKALYEFVFSYNTDTQELSSSTKGLSKHYIR